MNEIRKNTDEEKVLATAVIKAPTFLVVFTILSFVFAVFFIIIGFVIALSNDSDSFIGTFMATMGFLLIPIAIVMAVGTSAIKHCKCEVTNKRIKGVTTNFIIKKTYSYRFDEIDNVEITKFLGINALALNFNQGHGPSAPVKYSRGTAGMSASNTFRVSYIANAEALYEKLSELLMSLKNHEDVMIDIEMKKVEAANKQAEAIAIMASGAGSQKSNNNSGSYIEELKQLKELLDAGVITQEEFDAKKAELLSKK